MNMTTIDQNFSFPEKMWNDFHELFPSDFLRMLKELHEEFEPRRQKLLYDRKLRQEKYDQGELPQFLPQNSEAVSGNWRVSPLPSELMCRRVEITGPVNSAKMVINMLSRNDEGDRADMAMLDFEDSMKPEFINVLNGYKNVVGAVSGNLTFHSEITGGKNSKIYRLNPDDMAYVMVRCRGLHLDEINIQQGGTPVSAGLLDLATCFYHTAKTYLAKNQTPKYYIPKCEHYLEARWWNDLFTRLETSMGIKAGTLKATFLIETLPATFQIEEILYEIREHAAGLNVGRWDKIFSDIKVLRNHPDRIMADRASINMTCPWMENYAKRVIKICHSRGAFAMGGMSAFTPGKTQELRFEQTKKIYEDKKREAEWGHDGCWVSHPYFIGPAMKAFTQKNQLHVKLEDFDKYSDILPQGSEHCTLSGLRTNIRVGIAYMHGWNKGIGCVSFDNLMEDLATLEISRAQTWQWLHHKIKLEEGEHVSKDLIKKLFNEEREKIQSEILQDFPSLNKESLSEELERAKTDACELYLKEELPEFLSLASTPA